MNKNQKLLRECRERIDRYCLAIEDLYSKSKWIPNHKENEFWNAMKSLEKKRFWIQQDLEDYEIIGEQGWEEFSNEIEKTFKHLKEDCLQVQALLPPDRKPE